MKKFMLLAVAASTAALSLVLSGCGGGDVTSSGLTAPATSTPTPPATSAATVIGSILKGPVNAATVCVYKLDATATGKKGAQVFVTSATAVNGCVMTAADGSYSLSLPTGTTGDLIVEAGGGTYCSNEAQYDATAKTCAGSGGTPVPLSLAKLTTVIEAPVSGALVSAVVTPLSTSSFANMVAAGLASVVAFRSQFTTLVTNTGLPSGLSAATLANDPTLQSVLASFQKIAGTDPTVLSTFLTGLAGGSYRYGTGGFTVAPVGASPTPPTTPVTSVTPTVPANASNGILGGALATVFAGDYNLTCRLTSNLLSAADEAKFTFKVNIDGTTTLNGTPWIDASNTGVIELSYSSNATTATKTGSFQSPAILTFTKTYDKVFNVVAFSLLTDGSLLQAFVTTNSKQYNCPTMGFPFKQSVPPALSSAANSNFNSTIGQKVVRTEVVSGCAVGNAATVTIGADGSVAIGAVSYSANQIALVTDKTFDTPSPDGSGKRYSAVAWAPGRANPFVVDQSILNFGFDGSYKTKVVTATKPDGSALVACIQ